MPHFCAICGVVIEATSGSDFVLPIEDVQWHQELRAVSCEGSNGVPTLTGVGYLNPSERIIVPRDREQSYRSVISSSGLDSLFKNSNTWTFVFHAACWEILCERVSDGPSARNLIPGVLYNIIHCTPRDRHGFLRPGHDFGGAGRFQTLIGNPLRRITKEGLTHFITEPAKFVSMQDALRCSNHDSKTIQEDPGASITEVQKSPATTAPDVFSELPFEILYLMLALLPSYDIQQFRLASRTIAFISRTPFQLPQLFWRSRFAPSFEMGFAFPSDAGSTSQDWRTLYLAIRHALRAPNGAPRLWNRKRIWELVGTNASLMSLHIQDIQLHGATHPDALEPASQGMSHEIISAELKTRDTAALYVGSRQISVRSLRQPTPRGVHAVGVSMVTFNSRTFISGLRILFGDGDSPECSSHSIGYITKDSETVLRIGDPNSFDGFELAACVNGIAGLRIMSKNGFHSSWAGDIGKGEPDVAFGRIHIGDDMSSFNIICKFDAFKIVSFAVPKPKEFGKTDSKGYVWPPLWTPCHASNVTLIEIPENPYHQTFNPILNMNFGGARGEKLEKLTRIVVHMGDPKAAFLGVAFDYDGDVSLFGRQGETELSFLIDGPKGERISEVTTTQAPNSMGIRSLHIRTSFENSVLFIPDEFQSFRLGDVESDSPSPPPKKDSSVNRTTRTMRAPEGQVICGFTSILEIQSGCFQTFGLQSLLDPMQEDSMPAASSQGQVYGATPSTRKLCESTGSHVIRRNFAGCQANTHASLEGVKRIVISRGSLERPREANEVSGLRLEYFEEPSKIVGQWLTEGDHIDFSFGERIVEISIWVSKVGFSYSEKAHFGRVVSLSIVTSKQSKAVDWKLPGEDCIQYQFRENRLERLTSIAWSFNGVADHTRVLSSPIGDGIHLWHQGDYVTTFKWLVPEKILWEEDGPDRVTTITAYRSPSGRTYHITSLSFTYESGVSRRIGNFSGKPSGEVLSIASGEKLSRMELFSDSNVLVNIIVHLERFENGEHFQRYHSFEDARHPSTPSIHNYDKIDLSNSRYEEYDIDCKQPRLVGSGESPKSEAVGLWGFLMGSDGLSLGVIFSGASSDSAQLEGDR